MTSKLLVAKEAEVDGSTEKFKVRLVSYYHNAKTEYTNWRGNFDTYEEAHDFAMWWRKQK